MSGLVNKIKEEVKDTLHGDKKSEQKSGEYGAAGAGSSGEYGSGGRYGGNEYGSGEKATSGPHSSNVMNKADPRVDSDRDNSASLGAGKTTAGPHGSDMMNKADPRVDSDRDYSATAGSGQTTGGPHRSDMMNKADPRIDSDRDHRAAMSGAHRTDEANRLDPRIDSDADRQRNFGREPAGNAGFGGNAAGIGAGSTGVGSGPGYGSAGSGGLGSSGVGSGIGSAGLGSGGTTGASGVGSGPGYGSAGSGGLGSSGVGSGGVGSGLGSGGVGTGGSGMGQHMGSRTSDPHNSHTMNKIDPRTDTTRDAGRPLGGYPSGNTESGGEYIVQGGEPRGEESRSSVVDERRRASLLGEKSRDPRDASQVPPSVLQKEVGAPQPEDAQEQRSHHGLSLGALGHHGHRALHGKHKGQEETT